MYYISSASSITHQPTFQRPGFSGTVHALRQEDAIVSPDFKQFIDPGLLRRMSKILRMSVACAKDALREAGVEQPDSIVVGTGLGCLADTEKFLNNFLTIEGLLPPTSFIQSTHNTIAGQISLSLGNHGYNMTHTQNSLSFEHALLDGMLLLDEGQQSVLVGGADEYIEILDEIGTQLSLKGDRLFTSGVSFFVLSSERSGNDAIAVTDVDTVGLCTDIPEAISAFFERNAVAVSDVDVVLFANGEEGAEMRTRLAHNFPHLNESALVHYPDYCGYYATNSAFALHFAIDRMRQEQQIRNVFICNRLFNNNLGLTLLHQLET